MESNTRGWKMMQLALKEKNDNGAGSPTQLEHPEAPVMLPIPHDPDEGSSSIVVQAEEIIGTNYDFPSDDSLLDADFEADGISCSTSSSEHSKEPRTRSRWVKADPSNWKRNRNKKKRFKCQPYYDYKANLKEPKKPKIMPNHKCKFSCLMFDEDLRMACTLNISNRSVIQAFLGQDDIGGHYSLTDKRGKHPPKNKTDPQSFENVKNHIESFPNMESHYCRKNSIRRYLDSNLSIRKMHTLYKDYCSEKGFIPVSEDTYRRIFGKEFNLSFFVPKKDQCVMCNKYRTASHEGKTAMQADYEDHLRRKAEALKEKSLDKEKANTNNVEFKTISMDMQSVLQIPSTEVSITYYKRKLILHNFTIYEGALPNNAFCYAWTEINGKSGSSEVGSCIIKYVQQLPETIKELSIFSDTCSGQNRNIQIAALLLDLVQVTNLEIIDQKFMESGHSYMEVDSMHSAIEKQKKFVPIYCVNDWLNIFRIARSRPKKKLPYQAVELDYKEFYDLKKVAQKLIDNRLYDSDGIKVNWLKVKNFRYEKEKPFLLQYRYNFEDNFKSINVLEVKRKRKGPEVRFLEIIDFPKLYARPINISHEKKNDLIDLCRKGVVPEIFHSWFNSLPSKQNAKNRLPEAAMGEESETDSE